MVSKNQWRAIAIVLAVVLLLAAFMTGLTGIADGFSPVGDVREDYVSFKKELDTLSDNEKALADGKAEYAEKKAAYDEQQAAYNEKYKQYEAADKKYNEDVLSYNQQLIAYNVGKNQFNSSGAQSAVSSGRAQLDSGWASYNEGKAAYDQLLSAISELEAKHIPHWMALKIVGGKAGIDLTDSYISDMKAQLDSAYAQLQQGEAGLTQAQQQIDSAQAQLSGMKQEIESGPAKLDADGQSVADTKAELDKEKEALDAKAEELSVYEDIAEKVERSRESLIDEGYGTAERTTAELLSSAGKHESALHRDYLKALISFIVTYAAHLLAVAAAAAALILLSKKQTSRSFKLAAIGAALGAVSVVASLVYGDIDTLAFAAAVLAALGVGLSIGINAEE